MADLKLSGYDERERLRVLKGGIRTYEKLQEKVDKGERPLFRPPSFRRAERKEEKVVKKKSWYKSSNTNVKTVIFVDPSPNGELVKLLKDTEKIHKIGPADRIKFVQKSGVKVVDILKVDDPFRSNCNETNCIPCEGERERGGGKLTHCRKTNIGYKIECRLCKDRGIIRNYEGESSRNMYLRG